VNAIKPKTSRFAWSGGIARRGDAVPRCDTAHALWLALVLCIAPAALQPAVTRAQCIDEAIRDELNARRKYRGVQKRLFQKAGRHEISAMGGLYAADLLSSSYLLQGAYTFHFVEELGLEASFAYTRARSELVDVTDNQTAEGLTLSGGLGFKFLFSQWFALRMDVRDQMLSQELLGVSNVVHNLAATLGFSVFVPFES